MPLSSLCYILVALLFTSVMAYQVLHADENIFGDAVCHYNGRKLV